MPYPNEHAARLKDPGQFDEFRRTAGSGAGRVQGVKVPRSIDVIWGKKKGQAGVVAQALRFPVSRWTVEEARAWLKANDISFIEFEPAKEAD